MLIVLLLGFTIAPLSPSILVEFIVGAVLVIIGMVFFFFRGRIVHDANGRKSWWKHVKD